MAFDSTISVGHILNILAMLGGGLFFLWKMDSRLILLNAAQETFVNRLDKVDNKLSELTGVTIQLAKQEERMGNQDVRLQELSLRLDNNIRIYELASKADEVITKRKRIK